jgi:serine/threonine-protein kinase
MASFADETLGPGTKVGEYLTEGVLGEGGMGKVYAATHPVIAKRAAVKVLHPHLSANREAVERFVQEARSVNQIGHPNIVDIFAFGTLSDGRCYFVMERLDGESLRQRMKRERLSLVDALAILDTITIALEAAHDKGVIHRDLKPDNVFLVAVKNDRPQVKLLDFGIAKLLGAPSALTERTATGNLLGTPGYISPEQAQGYAVDHRTDIYALGAMAHELVTGVLPFPSDNAADMIARHLYAAPPSAAARNPAVPPALDEIITQMLAKDAGHRPALPIVRDVVRQLRRHLEGGQVVTTQARPATAMPTALVTASNRRRVMLWGSVVAFVLAAIVGGVVFMALRGDGRRPEEPAQARPTVTPIEDGATPAQAATSGSGDGHAEDSAKPAGSAKAVDIAKDAPKADDTPKSGDSAGTAKLGTTAKTSSTAKTGTTPKAGATGTAKTGATSKTGATIKHGTDTAKRPGSDATKPKPDDDDAPM